MHLVAHFDIDRIDAPARLHHDLAVAHQLHRADRNQLTGRCDYLRLIDRGLCATGGQRAYGRVQLRRVDLRLHRQRHSLRHRLQVGRRIVKRNRVGGHRLWGREQGRQCAEQAVVIADAHRRAKAKHRATNAEHGPFDNLSHAILLTQWGDWGLFTAAQRRKTAMNNAGLYQSKRKCAESMLAHCTGFLQGYHRPSEPRKARIRSHSPQGRSRVHPPVEMRANVPSKGAAGLL